ncbi:MAG: hypothetical protein HYZ23_06615 [Chloroflexi bacterium]|nr:hypothetical protein [Chloroflexota bacterium]
MPGDFLFQVAGWSALISTLVTLFTMATFAIGMKVGWENVGRPNDIAGVGMFLLYIPIFIGLGQTTHASFPALSWTLTIAGCLASAVAMVTQILFIAQKIEFQSTVLPNGLGGIIIGLAIIGFNWLILRNGDFPSALTIIGIVAYAGMALASIGSLIRQGHPLTWIGGSFSFLSVVWLAWAGWLWLEMTI